MRRIVLISLVALVFAGSAYWLRASRRPAWTTSSPEALAEYERGRDAAMRLYHADARAAYQRALELDPEFVAAKIALYETEPEAKERERRLAELRTVDRERLNERERFLLDVLAAQAEEGQFARRKVVDDFLARHPDDAFALLIAANDAWGRLEWPVAEQRYRRLLEVDPNWVMAHNHLGYIAMAQGDFTEAEARFRTYKYVAPDQANPHDSLGELLVLLGRYDEARAELEEALAIRPDFCASYQNLLRIALLERDPAPIDPLLERISRDCEPRMAQMLRCAAVVAHGFLAGDAEAPWRDADPACEEYLHSGDVLVHRLALVSGRRDFALAIEREVAEKLEEIAKRYPRGVESRRAIGHFLAAQRLSIDGEWEAAVAQWRKVDADGTFWQSDGLGILKLIGRRELAHALRQAGDDAGARDALARVRAVNPAFAEESWEHWPLAGAPASAPATGPAGAQSPAAGAESGLASRTSAPSPRAMNGSSRGTNA
jgi:tetratricopeptide (TPR) repeat protein